MNQLFKVALMQIDVQVGRPEANVAKFRESLEQAVTNTPNGKPDVILAPELWNTGFDLANFHATADVEGEKTKQLVSTLAKQYDVNIVAGSVANKKGSTILNTLYAFDRTGGQIAEYSKVHLFRLMQEEKHLTAGDEVGAFNLEGVPAGVMICYDIRFPELARKLALEGAKVLFVPAQWPHPRLEHWRTLLRARAIENQMFVVACNRIGTSGDTEFFGNSLVIDPWGDIIAEGDDQERILHATIDLSVVDKVRQTIPIFQDRRPAIY